MAFVHAKSAKFFINKYDISAYLNNVDMPRDVDGPEVTTFGNNDRKYITGLRNSTMSVSGFFDESSSLAIAALTSLLGKSTSLNVTYAPSGTTQGSVTYSVQAIKTNYTVSGAVDGAAGVTIDLQGNDVLSPGVSLHALTARTSAGNGSAYKQSGGSTSAGATAYLHVTALTIPATGRLPIAVQDSPTCSPGTWAALISFDNITSAGGKHQRKTVTGNVDQYVRSQWTRATTTNGAFSATFTIAFKGV